MSTTHRSLGIIVDWLGQNQRSYTIIDEMNEAVNFVCPIVFFVDNKELPLRKCKFAMMDVQEVWAFPHSVIATSVETAKILLECPLPTKKFFYMWDLDWLYKNGDFQEYRQIYRELTPIVRCEEHAQVIRKCWLQQSVKVIEDFNHEQIIELS